MATIEAGGIDFNRKERSKRNHILWMLYTNKGVIFSAESLAASCGIQPISVAAMIKRLRAELPDEFDIQTINYQGYRLVYKGSGNASILSPLQEKYGSGARMFDATLTTEVFGKPVSLSPTEFEIISVLYSRVEQIVSIGELMAQVGISKNAVYTNISRTRLKIPSDAPYVLREVRGVGYGLYKTT